MAIGFALGIATIGLLGVASFRIGTDPWLNVLLMVFGGLIGWIVGILATPFDSAEKSEFSVYVTAISTLVSGYVLGKLDSVFDVWLKGNPSAMQALGPALIFGSSVLLGTLITFIARKYLETT